MATEQYSERIGVRATPEEARAIERRAEELGLSKSRYLAELGARADVSETADAEQLERLHYQLKRGADRLGDLVEALRSEGSKPSGVAGAEAAIDALKKTADKTLEAL